MGVKCLTIKKNLNIMYLVKKNLNKLKKDGKTI